MTNQTVYVVLYCPDIETTELQEVFTTPEAAEEFIASEVAQYSYHRKADFVIEPKTLIGA